MLVTFKYIDYKFIKVLYINKQHNMKIVFIKS